MVNFLSPSIQTRETDNTGYIPGVPTEGGAIVGEFRWGPVLTPVQLTNERELVSVFGAPNKSIYSDFFTAVSFLRRASNLTVVRAKNDGAFNASGNDGNKSNLENHAIVSLTLTEGTATDSAFDAFDALNYDAIEANVTDSFTEMQKADGSKIASFGNGVLKVAEDGTRSIEFPVLDGGCGYGEDGIPTANLKFSLTKDNVEITDGADADVRALFDVVSVEIAKIYIGNIDGYDSVGVGLKGSYGAFIARYPGELGNSLDVYMVGSEAWDTDKSATSPEPFTRGSYVRNFAVKPDTNEVHILVIDRGGKFTGTAGTILEKYEFLSTTDDGVDGNGLANNWVDTIRDRSRYVWVGDEVISNSVGTASSLTKLKGGLNGSNTDRTSAWDTLRDAERYNNVSFFITGNVPADIVSHAIGIAEQRKDVVVFASPNDNGNPIMETNTNRDRESISAYFTAVGSSTYAFSDTAFGQMRDEYNNRQVWIPLNGETAGLVARSSSNDAPWVSPGGYVKGVYRNFSRISYSPDKIDRDWLYPLGINPVIVERGAGTLLYGDKTLTQKPSAFDRINVRRLFIVVRKAIVNASKFTLFELNNEATRLQYYTSINNFMQGIQGRGGVEAYRVIVDESNNTPDVIQRNELAGEVQITPPRSINFISLNFVATDNIVTFADSDDTETTATSEGI